MIDGLAIAWTGDLDLEARTEGGSRPGVSGIMRSARIDLIRVMVMSRRSLRVSWWMRESHPGGRAVKASSAESGSSSSRIWGSIASARATSTRWRIRPRVRPGVYPRGVRLTIAMKCSTWRRCFAETSLGLAWSTARKMFSKTVSQAGRVVLKDNAAVRFPERCLESLSLTVRSQTQQAAMRLSKRGFACAAETNNGDETRPGRGSS